MAKLDKKQRLLLALIISSLFVIVEVTGGILSNSLAILNDAAHLAIDSSGFLLALLAYYYSELPGTKIFSFGFGRIEVFGALISILSLWIITFMLALSAYTKAIDWFEGTCEPINGKLTFIFGVFGICVNLTLAFVFGSEHNESSLHMHDHSHGHAHSYEKVKVKSYQSDEVEIEMSPIKVANLDHVADSHNHSHSHEHHDSHDHHNSHDHNTGHCCGESSPIKTTSSSTYSGHDHCTSHHESSDNNMLSDANSEAAYLHVMTDLIQSIGVAIAGLIIWHFPHLQIVDPLCVFIFSFLVFYTTVPLVKKIMIILMDGTPSHIDRSEIEFQLKSISGVVSVHDLHVWSVSSNITLASVHIETFDTQSTLKKAQKILSLHGLYHTTIQVSLPDNCCTENHHEQKDMIPLCVV